MKEIDEIDNIFFAYQMIGDFEESEFYKRTLEFFDNIFKDLYKADKISETTFMTLDEALGELVSTAYMGLPGNRESKGQRARYRKLNKHTTGRG